MAMPGDRRPMMSITESTRPTASPISAHSNAHCALAVLSPVDFECPPPLEASLGIAASRLFHEIHAGRMRVSQFPTMPRPRGNQANRAEQAEQNEMRRWRNRSDDPSHITTRIASNPVAAALNLM